MKELQKQTIKVYNNIKQILETARSNAYHSVNFAMVTAYWQIGRAIVEEEQEGKRRADYGSYLIKELSKKLTDGYGKGFDESNLRYIRLFYLKFQICDAVRHESKPQKWHTVSRQSESPIHNALRPELSWTHYRLLLKVQNKDARDFYMHEAANSKWNTRELERQINSLLYERLAMSKDKRKVKELSTKGQVIRKPEDLIKDHYILEFLGIKEDKDYLEKDLERLLLNKLKEFLLELGKGFSFIAKQKRISVGDDDYYIDLTFYNYILKCFVLIDLKVGKLTHQDIGQMDFYVRYYEEKEKQEGDSPTIGLILCSDSNDAMVKYTMLKGSKRLFASKYKLYLPSEKELKKGLLNWRTEQNNGLA